MRVSSLVLWLFISWSSFLSPARAELPQTRKTVSIRELSIPPKALEEFNQGARLLKTGDAAESLTYFHRAIARYPKFYEAYYEAGMANLKLWRIATGEDNFRASIEVSNGFYPLPFFAMGAILDHQGRFGEAESVLRAGLSLAPGATSGNYYLGLALFGLNRLQEAEKSVRDVLLRDPRNVEALRLMIDIYLRAKNYAAALHVLDEYLAVDPSSEIEIRAKAIRIKIQGALTETAGAISSEK